MCMEQLWINIYGLIADRPIITIICNYAMGIYSILFSCLSSNFEEPVKYIARIVNKVNIKVNIKILAIHAIIDFVDKQVSAQKESFRSQCEITLHVLL
jgi:hypothetical protein